MAAPNVQRVPKMLLAVNDWIAAGKIDKEQGSALSNLTLMKNEQMMLLADEIGVTPDVSTAQHSTLSDVAFNCTRAAYSHARAASILCCSFSRLIFLRNVSHCVIPSLPLLPPPHPTALQQKAAVKVDLHSTSAP